MAWPSSLKLPGMLVLFLLLAAVAHAEPKDAEPEEKPKEVAFDLTTHFSRGWLGPIRTSTEFRKGEKVGIRYRIKLNPKTKASWDGVYVGHSLENSDGKALVYYTGSEVGRHVNPNDDTYTGYLSVDTEDLEPGHYFISAGFSEEATKTEFTRDFEFTVMPWSETIPVDIRFEEFPEYWLYSAGREPRIKVKMRAKFPKDHDAKWHAVITRTDLNSGKLTTLTDMPLENRYKQDAITIESEGLVTREATYGLPIRLNQAGKFLFHVIITETTTNYSQETSFSLTVVNPFDDATP